MTERPAFDGAELVAAYYRPETNRPADEPYSQGDILVDALFRPLGAGTPTGNQSQIVITQTCDLVNLPTPKIVQLIRVDRLDEILAADGRFFDQLDNIVAHRKSPRHFLPGNPAVARWPDGTVLDLIADFESQSILTWGEFRSEVARCRKATLADNAARHLAQRFAARFDRVPLPEVPKYAWKAKPTGRREISREDYVSAVGRAALLPTGPLTVEVLEKSESARGLRFYVATLEAAPTLSTAAITADRAVEHLITRMAASLAVRSPEALNLLKTGLFKGD